MTQVRYEKINGKLKTMAANNATATAAGSAAAASVDIEDTTAALAGEGPMPDEAVKVAAAEIFQRPRLTNKERLAAECLKQRWVLSGMVRTTDQGPPFVMHGKRSLPPADGGPLVCLTDVTQFGGKFKIPDFQIPRPVRPVPEAQVRPPEIHGRVADEEVPPFLLFRPQGSSEKTGLGPEMDLVPPKK